VAVLLGLAVACDGEGASSGVAVTTTISAKRQQELAELQAQLDTVKDLDAAGFAAKYAVPFTTTLGYDPLTANGLDRIKASSFALGANEEAALAANGFVTTDRRRFPTFIYGYQSIYTDDLPVYVSADSILYAVHESFDEILKGVEATSLRPKLSGLLDRMRAALRAGAGSDISAAARADADLYLAVAASLLAGEFQGPVAGGDAGSAQALYAKATAAAGMTSMKIFGVTRDIDFSQFEPRGHYTDTEALKTYFRATMWLGRIDLRLLETQPDHSQVFRRNQLEAAYVLRALMDEAALTSWKQIDATIGGFVGEPDNMTLPQLDALLADLKIARASELAGLSDATIAQAIVEGSYGAQRISSHIMVNGLGSGTMPLSSTFLLLGQRYVLDSHVFSNVVWDRVKHGRVKRMMPSPLDAGFAALHNDQAGLLLGPELARYDYASDLASMRILADAHPQEYWHANLYNEWLSMLRTLSPTPDVANPTAVGLPRVAGTEPWGRRLLSTQLASWAELRHDTILYVKQSYTGAAACEYPDAYVDPYPELFAKLASFAARGATLMAELDEPSTFASSVTAYFERLRSVAATLEVMAKNQRAGAPHSAAQLAFINQLTFENGCGTPTFDGWYAKLFFAKDAAVEFDPVIADVHTQPTDEAGNTVGRVLHVGTGMPRTMVVTVESCSGPRAYVGLVSSYHERITQNFERLTDKLWQQIAQTPPGDVDWMTDLIQR
ncbi:MAG: DUF3160 domain-containing protein, partial [Labilithrix sp.]|nr:DUF3160 domain-containing protein [Labilithrix sp.]